jgi:hypothetical protein
MQMEVTGMNQAKERVAQAKRTSETTEIAAKKAFESGPVVLKRNKFLQVTNDGSPQPATSTPIPVPTPAPALAPPRVSPSPAAVPATTSTIPAFPSKSTGSQPLDAEEIKSEQARLLTLMRSLNPVLVVDQICTALAYFGGIPGAPPPADGIFPSSAGANGSGRLFIGWLSEIFPNLSSENYRALTPFRDLQPQAQEQAVKRKPGRPKGSKSSKVRSDKGKKKGSRRPVSRSNINHDGRDGSAEATVDDSWVDVDGDETMTPSRNLLDHAGPLVEAPSPSYPEADIGLDDTPMPKPLGRPKGSRNKKTLLRLALNPESEERPKRSRGRPKGSKNKPKPDTPEPEEEDDSLVASVTQEEDVAPVASVQSKVRRKRKRKTDKTSQMANANDVTVGDNAAQAAPIPVVEAVDTANTARPSKRRRKAKDGTARTNGQTTVSTSTGAATSASKSDGLQVSSTTHGELPLDPTLQGIQPQQQAHFPVESPPFESYEAQLQAQLEQVPEPEPQAKPKQATRVDSRLMANRIQQRQHQQQQSQQVQQSQNVVSQTRSPIQQQVSKPQTASPMAAQQAARASQTQYPQYRTNSPYNQPQTYSPQQPHQQFPSQKQSPQIPTTASQGQQFSTASQQAQPQYSSNQQQYGSGQNQYATGQQQVSSQQRYQHQLGTSSPGTASFNTHQSPQFTSSASNSFNSNDGRYAGGSAAGLGTTSFTGQRSQTGTPAANGYNTGATRGLSQQHHSPSFNGAATSSQPQRTATGNGPTTTPSMQHLQQSFAAGGAAEWIFDPSNLEATAGGGHHHTHNTMNPAAAAAAAAATYTLNPGTVPRGATVAGGGSTPGASFAQSAMASFDASGLAHDRYYGVSRR